MDLSKLVAIVDTREQLPLDLKLPDGTLLTHVRRGLRTGDYSLDGFSSSGKPMDEIVAIERKSLNDLVGCIGVHRARFEKCLERLEIMPIKAIVVESSWTNLEMGWYRSRVHPNAAVGSCLSWIARGIPIIMCGNPTRASEYTARLLVHSFRHYMLDSDIPPAA